MSKIEKLEELRVQSGIEDKGRIEALEIDVQFDWRHIFPDEKVITVACDLMQQIGLQGQPFLVYRKGLIECSFSIVTVKGGKTVSKSAAYAAGRVLWQKHTLKPSDLSITEDEWEFLDWQKKIVYGKTALHTSFNIVLSNILYHYHYKSLDALNYILRFFRMEASVEEDRTVSPVSQELVYYPLDRNDKRKALHIKASDLTRSFTLEDLYNRCKFNRTRFVFHHINIRERIDYFFELSPLTLCDFKTRMERYGRMMVIFENNKDGSLQNIWYLDYLSQLIIDAETLGGNYTVDAMRRRCVPEGSYSARQRLIYLNRYRKFKSSRVA